MNLRKNLLIAIAAPLAAIALATENVAHAERKIETVSLTVSPAKVSVPALEHRLTIDPAGRIVGNAAIDYHRAVLDIMLRKATPEFVNFERDKLIKWIDEPIGKLPTEEARKFLATVRLGDLERAARRSYCDWQVPLEEEAFETRLTEFQEARSISRILMLKTHLEIAEGRYDDAIKTLAISFQMSRHLDEGRTLITSLIGVATASLGLVQVEYLIGEPNAPSLYWALSALPTPFIAMDTAIDTESVVIEHQFPQLKEFRSRILSKEDAKRLSDEMFAIYERVGEPINLGLLPLAAITHYPRAKKALIDSGRPAAAVELMPVEQVLWLDSFVAYARARDELFKWARLPVRERPTRIEPSNSPSAFELSKFLPAIDAALNARERTDRKFAILRVVEAVRLYAGAHGKLPQSLDEIKEVPVPRDPLTGAPFLYRLNGDEAAIETEATSMDTYARHYLLKLRK